MGLKLFILVSSVVAVISLLVANHPASTQTIAAAAPYINHALAWIENLSLPEVWTFVEALVLWSTGDGTGEMLKGMSKFFGKVEIKREEVNEAEKMMRGDLVETWDEQIFHDTSTGIPENKFEEFVNHMMKRLGINYKASVELKGQFMQMKYLDSKKELIWKFGLEYAEFSSLYGFVSFKKDYRGKINAVYAIHSLRAKMADKVTITTNYILWILPWSTETSVEPLKFGTKDIDKIRSQYFKNRALEAFKENGLLEEIKYI